MGDDGIFRNLGLVYVDIAAISVKCDYLIATTRTESAHVYDADGVSPPPSPIKMLSDPVTAPASSLPVSFCVQSFSFKFIYYSTNT